MEVSYENRSGARSGPVPVGRGGGRDLCHPDAGGVDYSFEAIGTETDLDAGTFLRRERKLQGSGMGSNRFWIGKPRYIKYYREGRLKLDELVSQRLSLDQVTKAFEDMKQGDVARSVITFPRQASKLAADRQGIWKREIS